jgi:hypothetical protein
MNRFFNLKPARRGAPVNRSKPAMANESKPETASQPQPDVEEDFNDG